MLTPNIIKELCYIAVESMYYLTEYLRLIRTPEDIIDNIVNMSIDKDYNIHTDIVLEFLNTDENIENFCDYIIYNVLQAINDSFIYYDDGTYTFRDFLSETLYEINVGDETINYIIDYHESNVNVELDFSSLSLNDNIELPFSSLTL